MRIISREDAGRLGAVKTNQILQERYQERLIKYKENPSICQYCNQHLSYKFRKNKFCNQSCSASFNNKNKTKLDKRKCLFCSNDIDSYNNKRKYCSQKCCTEHKNQINENNFINGNKKPKTNSSAKKYLINLYGDKCSICNTSEWMNKKLVMVLDHIDGNSENYDISNLRLLCPNCDSLTDTYKGKNKGKGRFSRRQRYAEGKSY